MQPNIKDKIYDCKITTLDFKVDEKFSQIKNKKEIVYLECNGYKIHRTHLNNTKFLQIPTIKRKNIGKGVDRIKLEIENFTPSLYLYYG